MMEQRTARALYRALARAARALDAAAPGPAPTPLASQLRAAFPRSPGALTLTHGLALLRHANARLHQLQAAPAPAPTPGAPFLVGQVVRHRVKNYRAVVLSYDSQCRAGAEWRAQNPSAAQQQPWFKLAVCTLDRPSPQVTYVPMDALELLSLPVAGQQQQQQQQQQGAQLQHLGEDALLCHVAHPLLHACFHSYDATIRAYLARPHLAEAFAGDAALLLRASASGGGGGGAPSAMLLQGEGALLAGAMAPEPEADDSEGGSAKTLA